MLQFHWIDSQVNLNSHPYHERNGEGGQRQSNLEVGDGDDLAHQGSAEEEDPEGGEGKAADSGEEGHGAGQVDISVEHGSLG